MQTDEGLWLGEKGEGGGWVGYLMLITVCLILEANSDVM